jgi:hypothetical protein
MPQWLVLLCAVVVTCVVVAGLVVVRQRRIGEDDDSSETPDVIEYMTMMIGVVYAIVLGLAIAGVWEARNAADDVVHREALALHEVQEGAQVFHGGPGDRVRSDVHRYVRYTVDREWPHMLRTGELTGRGDDLMDALRHDVRRLAPEGTVQSQTYQAVAGQAAAADAARVQRGDLAGSTMPGVVWLGLAGGAALTLGMLFALQIRRSARELVLSGLFSALMVFLLFLVWHFDSPFGRGLADPTGAFTSLFPSVSP